MPSRIISSNICKSESLAELTWFEQMLFIRLIVSADDYGRYDARPQILKGSLFPFDDITVSTIQKAITKLSTNDMISLYEVAGKPYLELCAWRKYNTPRAKESRYPENPIYKQPQADENICKQPQADSPDIRNSIFDIRNSIFEYSGVCAELGSAASAPVITLPLNDKTEYPVFQEQCQEWAGLYPAVDVIQQLRNMKGWLDANPSRRKTKAGIKRFITSWLAKEQDRGVPCQQAQQKKSVPVGASGVLGAAELEAIHKVLREE